MSTAYAEYLRGKRVVLVGPSVTLAGSGQGALIDSHDVVVRVNRYTLADEAVRADVGSRTDALYHVLYSANHERDLGWVHTNEEIAQWRADGVQYLVTRHAANNDRIRRMGHLLGDLPLVLMDRQVREGVERACRTNPNTGILAIAHLLSLPIASLHVTGFDFYAAGYYGGYVGFTDAQAARGGGDGVGRPAWGQTNSKSIVHEQSGQKAYLVDLYRRDARLTFGEGALAALGLPSEGPGITALVPMKGHSERVPGKNTRLVAGKPLLAWLLVSLTKARRIDRVVVDTDDERIAALVSEHAPTAHVLIRPDHLRDAARVSGNDLIAWEMSQVDGDHFGQFHVTSPLLMPATVDRAVGAYFDAVERGEADSLFGVTEHHIWLFRADGTPLNSDTRRLVRSQDLEPLYEDNNALHLFSRASFDRTGSRIGERPRMFEVPKSEAVDIDYEDDLRIAEALLLTRNGEAAEAANRPKGRYVMGSVVYSTSQQKDGSYAIRGAVNGVKRTVIVSFEGGVAPTIAMCQQALLDGGSPPAGVGEPVAPSSPATPDSSTGQQPAAGAEPDDAGAAAVAALLAPGVAALKEAVAGVNDAALLEAALAAEGAGKQRATALKAIEARIAELAQPAAAGEPVA